jgi:predicted porin
LHNNFILPTYVSLDAALGLKASPANGWWFNLTGGYQIRTNDMAWMIREGYVGYCTGFVYGKAKVAYGSIELKYDYKDLFDCTLKATYYHWDLSKPKEQDGLVKQITLALKPELEVNAEVGMKPMSGLRVNVGYEYVKRCEGLCEPVSNLYVGVDYALMKNLSVYGHVQNLMNKEYVRADAYPAQKMNALVGLSLRF